MYRKSLIGLIGGLLLSAVALGQETTVPAAQPAAQPAAAPAVQRKATSLDELDLLVRKFGGENGDCFFRIVR